MGEKNKISMAVIRRLPKYHRYLKDLLDRDITRISSKELSDIIGFTASQIRQDLNNFGGFGQQGYGYNVEELYHEIGKILGVDRGYNTIIIGAGNLGQALANYSNFEKVGFHVKALFDINPRLIGITLRDVEIKDIDVLEEFVNQNNINLAVICTNKDNAQDVADKIVNCGINAIWNFAPTDLRVPENVIVENVHLIESLLTLTYLYKTSVEDED